MRSDRGEIRAQDRDLQIFVLTGLATEPQIDRPTADHAPVDADVSEMFGRLFRPPRTPSVERRTVPVLDRQRVSHSTIAFANWGVAGAPR